MTTPALSLNAVARSARAPVEAIGSLARRTVESVGSNARFIGDTIRATGDTRTWVPELTLQMRRLGVDSLPIGLFLAAFTGIVLALLASYSFTGAVPL
jgi:phospholipid/cholesterol/gamma-HCH transport system permease protein